MNKHKILVVDDEEDLCEILKYNLENEGFEVEMAYSAEEALELNLDTFSLLILDIMMGKMSGFKMAEKIKKEKKLSVPIIFLTAKDTENDTLTGFSLGADDYISKPFSVRQVIARVKAVLNRTNPKVKLEESIIYKGLKINANRKIAQINNESIKLTKKEFEILKLLVENPGRIYSREEILDEIWKENVIVGDRTIDVNIARIRKKMGSYGKTIVNRSGYGYCFDSEKI